MAATLILTYHLDPCSCCRFLPFKNILWRSNPVSLTEASPVEDDVERVGELGDTSGLYKNRYKHRTKAVDCVSRADKKKNKGDVPDVPIGGYKRMESEKPEEKGADSAKVKEPKKRRKKAGGGGDGGGSDGEGGKKAVVKRKRGAAEAAHQAAMGLREAALQQVRA